MAILSRMKIRLFFVEKSVQKPKSNKKPYWSRTDTIQWKTRRVRVRGMVFNATFNNISAISWWSVLLTEETGVPRESHWSAASQPQTLSHNAVSSALRLIVVIDTDCIGSYKSNYHMITTTTTNNDLHT